MTDDELYLFDLNGFIVIEGLLSADEVDRCNQAIDHQIAADVAKVIERPPAGTLDGGSSVMAGTSRRLDMQGDMLAWERPWCDPFRLMLTHPKIVDIFNEVLDEGFRLDHGPCRVFIDEVPFSLSGIIAREQSYVEFGHDNT